MYASMPVVAIKRLIDRRRDAIIFTFLSSSFSYRCGLNCYRSFFRDEKKKKKGKSKVVC